MFVIVVCEQPVQSLKDVVGCLAGSMLKINPEERLSISELVNQLQEVAAARNVNPKSPITEVSQPHTAPLELALSLSPQKKSVQASVCLTT